MRKLLPLVLTVLAVSACDEATSNLVTNIIATIFQDAQGGSNASEAVLDGTLMELPAIVDGDDIIEYEGYVSSYNHKTLIPNWVAYELTDEELEGDVERGARQFSMDSDVKGRQAMREDYYNSGWTKGHMAPATDFRWSSSAMDDTFYFMNVCPQNEYLNGKDWEYLEGKVRHWARQYGKVWVVTGPIIGDNMYGTIGDRNVVVPDAFFKAVLVPDGKKYSAIAFVMGNDSQRYWLKDCAITVDELEDITGIDFFPALEDSVENAVESRYSESDWGL